MNLSTVTTASIATLKAFARSNNLIPTGDLRLKATWLNAVRDFLTPIATQATQAIATATTPEAIQSYKASAIVALRFTYRAFVISCLLAIALGMSAADAWVEFRTLLEFESENVKFSQPLAVLTIVTARRRRIFQNELAMRWENAKFNFEYGQFRAKKVVKKNAIEPAQEFRQRINAARYVITH